MRILAVHNRYRERGGEDAVFESEVALLRRYGHDVVPLLFDNETIAPDASLRARAGLAVATVWSQDARRRVRDALGTARADVAHFHNTFPLVSPAVYGACREQGVAVVQTLHNYRLLCPSATFFRDGRPCEDCLGRTPPWPAIVHACYRGSRAQTAAVVAMLTAHRMRRTWAREVDVFVALTAFARQKFIEGGIHADRVAIKPNFAEPDPGAGQETRSGYLFAGRLVEEKGIRTLLRAWSAPGVVPRLRIAGDGPLAAAVTAAAERCSNIEYIGPLAREALHGEMRRAQALIFPSLWYEGFPVTIAEAFACGLPVVASRVGSLAEIVEDGRTGRLFTADDPGALADTVASAAPAALEAMSIQARREYETCYTGSRNYEMLLDIYRRAIASVRSDRAGRTNADASGT